MCVFCCDGSAAVRVVAFTNVVDAAVPSKLTVASAVKLVPVTVIESPPRGVPLVGEIDVRVGGLL